MKANKRQFNYIILILFINFVSLSVVFAGTATKLSNIFTLDTREINPIPVDGWQILTEQGNSHNEDIIIDNFGKVWCFYYASSGANQPLYLKIFKSDGYQYKFKSVVGHGFGQDDENYNSVRAALNDLTGDVWVAAQGANGGYFVIYDSTGNVVQDSTNLGYDTDTYLPKIAAGKDGKMWMSWHTNLYGAVESNAVLASFNSYGQLVSTPLAVGSYYDVFNTDIAVDDSNHIWVYLEENNNGIYNSWASIYNDTPQVIHDGIFISDSELTLNTQRSLYADNINKRMWILEKNIPANNHHLHLYGLNGVIINSVTNVGACGFARNESNQIEVVRFNDTNELNKVYEYALFNPFNGDNNLTWATLFDSTYQFVKNCITFNRNFNTLKVYSVQKGANVTKLKFQNVSPGHAEISVKPTTIDFDTTKILPNYQKQRIVTVQNNGNDVLTVYDINSQDARFWAVDTSFQLQPQQSRNVILKFAPTDTNTVTSQFNVLSNDPTNSTVEVIVSGRGYSPSQPNIKVSPPTLVFDTVIIGSKQTQYLYVENDDAYEPLQVFSITNSDSQFYVNKSVFTVMPKRGEWVIVTFEPKVAAELIADSLRINSNDPDTSAFIVPLFATSREPNKPVIYVEPDSIYFGEVAVDAQKQLNLTVSNRGEADLVISGVSSNKSQFTVNRTQFTVPSNETDSIVVKFIPTDQGSIAGKITIFNNDGENPEIEVPVTGVGILLSDPYLVYDQTEIFFGNVPIGDTLERTIKLENFGDRTLEISNISTSNSSFLVIESTLNLEKQQSYYLKVRFLPQDTLNYNAQLEFTTNDPSQQFVEISLFGRGISRYQQITVLPTHIDFGKVLINSSFGKYMFISNSGYQTITVSNILSDNNRFVTYPNSFQLSNEQSKQVWVTFAPNDLVTFNGKLTIISNDPVADSLEVTVTGVGRDSTVQNIELSANSLQFGTIAKNNSKLLYLTVHNRGERNLVLDSISTLSNNSAFTPQRTNLTVPGLSSMQFNVSFTPSEIGAYSDSLKILSNDPQKKILYVKLTGTGRAPLPQDIYVDTQTLNFGNVAIGRARARSFWVQNRGEQNLTINRISVDNNLFDVSDSWLVLEPNQSAYVSVTFTPVEDTTVYANLTLSSNDPDTSNIVIGLSGTGQVYTGPEVVIYPEVLNFGNTLLGVKKQLSFWIYNYSSTSILHIYDYNLTSNVFWVTYQPTTIAPGGSGFIRVAYQPYYESYDEASLTISTDDEFSPDYTLYLNGHGVPDNVGQNALSYWGWSENGYAPLGDGFSGIVNNYSANVLSNENQQAWFIKDVYLYEYPEAGAAIMNLAFKNEITLIINNTLVMTDTSYTLTYWNSADLDVSDYLQIGRNRIAVSVRTLNNQYTGGFDCQLLVNGNEKIRRGDVNWMHEDAAWWYFYNPGMRAPTDTLYNRMWFSRDYAFSNIDSVVASWLFEPNGSDTLYDSSPYGQRAILHNVTWVSGMVGQAMQFSGSANSYAELNTNLNFMPQSIEMWLNCDDARTYRQNVITNKVAGGYGNGLFIDPDLHFGVYYHGGEILFPNFTIDKKKWINISVQYRYIPADNQNEIILFANGEVVGTHRYGLAYATSGANKCYLAGNPLEIENSSFYGALDELKIKNTTTGLTPVLQIATIALHGGEKIISTANNSILFDIYPADFKIISGKFYYLHGGLPGSEVVIDSLFWNPDSIYHSPLKLTIPVEYLDIRGIGFALELRTNYGHVFYPEFGPEEYGGDFLQYETSNEASNLTLYERTYRMISVPYLLQDETIYGVLHDDLGDYDPYTWRLFEWNQDSLDYVEYLHAGWNNDHGFELGRAYWLVTDVPKTFDAENGLTPNLEDYIISLKPGWNMIASPFPFPVQLADIITTNEDALDYPFYYQTGDSIGWRQLDSEIYYILPWEGYLVHNSDSVEQSIIIQPWLDAGHDTAYTSPKALPKEKRYQAKYPDLKMLVAADVRCGKYFDDNNLFGVTDRASNGKDKYDVHEVPPIGDFVSLWINNNNWEDKAGSYTSDFRKSGADGYSWDLVLDYSQSNPAKALSVTFKEVFQIPEKWVMYLFDLNQDIAINLKEESNILFTPLKGKADRKKYKLVIGTEEYVQTNSDNIPLVPLAFELKQNYPNPFNSSTTIVFSLPNRMHTKVQIFNIMGQLVKTIADGELRGGLHQLIWDGRNEQETILSTGMYFIRIESENKADVKKMLLIK